MPGSITSKQMQSLGTLAHISQSKLNSAANSSAPIERIREAHTFQLYNGLKVHIELIDDDSRLKQSSRSVGDEMLTIIYDRREVCLRGKFVKLSKQRFKVFEYLFKNYPRSLTFPELASGAWEEPVANKTPRDEIHRMRNCLDRIGILLPIVDGKTWIEIRPLHSATKLQ
jgi:hypothetical protein